MTLPSKFKIKLDGVVYDLTLDMITKVTETAAENEKLREENTVLKNRLAVLGEREMDLQVQVYRLESEARGCSPHATWYDAAVDERVRRVKAEKELISLQQEYDARDAEACELIERWLDVGQPHDWTGFQERVEKFLCIDLPEPIPPGITWRTEQGNFYDGRNKGQGEAFLTKWYPRRSEFPQFLRNNIGRP